MTAEERPLLSGALPALERLVLRWEKMQETYPHLRAAIESALGKITDYYNRAYSNPAYTIAMGMSFL